MTAENMNKAWENIRKNPKLSGKVSVDQSE